MFPIVGMLLGLVIVIVSLLVHPFLGVIPFGGVLVGVDVVITGGLHLDGVADCGDGLIAPLSREKRLLVMAEPQIGAFGAITVGTVLLLRFSYLSSSFGFGALIIGGYGLSRAIMALLVISQKPARSNSMIGVFGLTKESETKSIMAVLIVEVVAIVAVMTLLEGARPLVGIVFGSLLAILVVWRARSCLGGVTGDVLGAAGVAFEVGFFLSAIR